MKIKKRDVLKELYHDKVSVSEIRNFKDKIFEKPSTQSRIYDLLMFSKIEKGAWIHGAPWSILAKWRYEGWPQKCPVCNKKVVPEKFGWMVKKIEKEGYKLVHIDCLDKLRKTRNKATWHAKK